MLKIFSSGTLFRRNGEAEGSGGLEVNDEVHPCRPLDRQVPRPLALQNPGGVLAHQTPLISEDRNLPEKMGLITRARGAEYGLSGR
jgi:hypothetical protein